MSVDAVREKKVFKILYWVMAVGLFLQLTGKVLYASGSMNGVHVYLLLVLPALFLVFWAGIQKIPLFASDVKKFLLLAGSFLLVSSLSALWSDGEESVIYVLKKSLVVWLYLVAVIYLASTTQWKHIKWFLAGVCVVVALGAAISLLYQLTVVHETFGWRTFRIQRMGYGDWIDLGYPVIAGIYFAMFAVLSASLIAVDAQDRKVVWLLALAILLVLPYVFQTFSRTSWIAGIVSIAYLLVAFRHRASLVLAACLGFAVLMLVIIYYDQVVVEMTRRQLSGRPQIWLWTINRILENPVFGHGFSPWFALQEKHKMFSHAHNFYLQVLFEQGLLGLACFLGMLVAVFRAVWKARKDRMILGAFALVVYILTVMLVEIEHVVTRPGLFWTIFWFPLGLVMGLVNRQSLDSTSKLTGAREE